MKRLTKFLGVLRALLKSQNAQKINKLADSWNISCRQGNDVETARSSVTDGSALRGCRRLGPDVDSNCHIYITLCAK